MKISDDSIQQSKIIDSIGYLNKHKNLKSLIEEYNQFSENIISIGFLDFKSIYNKKINDSTFLFKCSLGIKTKHLYIYTTKNDDDKILKEIIHDTLKIKFTESEIYLKEISKKLEQKGFSMAKVQMKLLNKKEDKMFAELLIETNKKRHLDNIMFKGYDKFPENHKINLIKQFKNKVFNQSTLENLNKSVNKFRFVNQIKYPEILFKKDSTVVYVYIEKAKSNTFDGIIGFSNDENSKLIFNGYLDLQLNNILNSGERFALFWKSNGQEQRTFNLNLELPYIFNSKLGLKTELNIFKQDSTFQNTKTAINLGYFFNYNSRLYLGYETNESSDIQNTNSASISDFTNKFYTTSFDFLTLDREDALFSEKTNLKIKFGLGERNSKIQDNNQVFTIVNIKQNVNLNSRNSINLKLETFYLKSEDYLISELYRFGGINSIRGFNENSLQANFLSSIQSEYRYRLSSNLYVHSIIDYGYFEDKTINSKNTLYGIGLGFGVLTKNGLLSIIYANGNVKEQNIILSNSIIHISLKANF